jgi:hypothetical protein
MNQPNQQGGSLLLTAAQNIVSAINGLSQALKGSNTPPLIVVATPNNANAAAAGVAIGQLYRDSGNPSFVYVRTA